MSNTESGDDLAQQGGQPSHPPRARTFLRGIIHADDRKLTIDCVVRDISDSGAKLTFVNPVSLPDDFELEIPQKDRVYQAIVRRRSHLEVGVEFKDARSGDVRRNADLDLHGRIEKLEQELLSLTRLVKKISSKVLKPEDDI